jgi:hypothetical protein
MDEDDIRDLISNEVLRLQIQKYPDFTAWYASLLPNARQMFDILMEGDVTPEMIELAQSVPDHEWDQYQFLRAIGGGNPNPEIQLALTNVTLIEIFCYLDYKNKS